MKQNLNHILAREKNLADVMVSVYVTLDDLIHPSIGAIIFKE